MPVVKQPTIYQIRVDLLESRPPIWRRLQVLPDMTPPHFHRALQIAMGWENYHLHEFVSGGKCYAEADPEDHHFGREVADQRRVRLKTLLPAVGSTCGYHYDFGDNWRHEITLESILTRPALKRYPVCLAGERSAPPEDSGGMYGYERYLKALFDRNHPDHREMLQWRGRFDPEYFSRAAVNRKLEEEFPLRSRAVRRPSVVPFPPAPSSSASFEEGFNRIVSSLIHKGRLPQPKRKQVRPKFQIPVRLTARERELIAQLSFAGNDLAERLQLDPEVNKSRVFISPWVSWRNSSVTLLRKQITPARRCKESGMLCMKEWQPFWTVTARKYERSANLKKRQ